MNTKVHLQPSNVTIVVVGLSDGRHTFSVSKHTSTASGRNGRMDHQGSSIFLATAAVNTSHQSGSTLSAGRKQLRKLTPKNHDFLVHHAEYFGLRRSAKYN